MSRTNIALYHGGVPGLKPGDLLVPGHARKHHDGCKWCEARAKGEAYEGMDGPSQEVGVYMTSERLYAKYHASLYGYGDLYRVEPVGELRRSTEDSWPTFISPEARVVSVYDRAVRLTDTERRRLQREWDRWDIYTGALKLVAERAKERAAAGGQKEA
jgi:hypothetical protein